MSLSYEQKIINQEVERIHSSETFQKNKEVFERCLELLVYLSDIGIFNLRTLELAVDGHGEAAIVDVKMLATAVKALRTEIPNISIFILMHAIRLNSENNTEEFNEALLEDGYREGETLKQRQIDTLFVDKEYYSTEMSWTENLIDESLRIHSLIIGSSRDISFSLDFVFPEVSPSHGLVCKVVVIDKSLEQNAVVAEENFTISQVSAKKAHHGELFFNKEVRLKGRFGTNPEKYRLELRIIDQESNQTMLTRRT